MSLRHRIFAPKCSPRGAAARRRRPVLRLESLEGRQMLSATAFDFGTASSPLAAGYARVSQFTVFSSSQGYGWLTPGVQSADRNTADPLTRDLNYAQDATFGVDLPNGTYSVGLTMADTLFPHDQVAIDLEGTRVDTIGTLAAGQVGTYTYNTTVTDGQLTLRLRDLGGVNAYWVLNGLTVSPADTPPSNAASFVGTDASTQGSWKGAYGADGQAIAALSPAYPAYAQVSLAGQSQYTWAASTGNARALQKPDAVDRIASTWFSASSFTIDVNLADGRAHQVSLYAVDYDGNYRTQRLDVLDAGTGAVLDSRTITSFNGGVWLSWSVQGRVQIRATRLAGANAVISGLFFGGDAGPPNAAPVARDDSATTAEDTPVAIDVPANDTDADGDLVRGSVAIVAGPAYGTAAVDPATGVVTYTPAAGYNGADSFTYRIADAAGATATATVSLTITPGDTAPPSNSATFVQSDSTTRGTWKGAYGADGQAIAALSPAYPAYAQVSLAGQSQYTWAASTGNARALQKPDAVDRIASTWFSASSFTIDVNLADGRAHQVSLYAVDWDTTSRSERLDVLDAETGAVLDSRTLTSFNGGVWLTWSVQGHVQIRVTRLGGLNAVVNGLFFGGASAPGEPGAPVYVSNGIELQSAINAARPGTTILLRPGTYQSVAIGGLQGTAEQPIIIGAADPNNRPVISGGLTGLYVTDSAYLEIRDLNFANQSVHALNIDDGGTYDTPSHHITLRNLRIANAGSDAVKLSGVNDFLITGLAFDNNAAFNIDMVGSHNGVVEKSTLLGRNYSYGGIQAKGGSSDIVIRDNRIEDMVYRGINIGGNTSSWLFRPVGVPYEAARITVEGNVIIGGASAVSFATSQDSVVRFNTILDPQRWAFRILAENTGAGMEPTTRGVFTDNIVAYNSTRLEDTWNGSSYGIEPQTFQFARNWWFAYDNPAASAANLPTPELDGVIGVDPQFVNRPARDVRLRPGSPAQNVGAYAPRS